MNIDYNLYKIFLYLFEEKSISKTANKLYVSQPAISYSLKELENQLGYTLFYRNSKGIEPTTEAKELYSYISTAFNILSDAEEHIKNLNQLNTGCIRIGIPTYLSTFFIKDTMKEFREQYPGITFQFVCERTSTMLEMLEMRKLDLILDILPIEVKKNIKKIVLCKYQNCFAYHKKSNYSGKIETIEDLEKYPIILPGTNSSLRLKLEEWLESRNNHFPTIIEAWESHSILDLTKSKMGIGYFIKEEIQEQELNDLEIISLKEELPSVDICLLYIEDFLTTATKKFVNEIKTKYNK